MIAPFAIDTLRDGPALAAIEDEWWGLWRQVPAATPFQSPAWLGPWWNAFSPGTLCVAAVRRQGRLVGLAPFYIEDGAQGRRVLPVGIAVSDYLDLLLQPEMAAEIAEALSRHVAGQRWDRWELSELSADAFGWLLPRPAACEDVQDHASLCLSLSLAPGPGGFAAAIPARKRRKIRMARNRVARAGGMEIVRADPSDIQSMLTALMRLHALRWASRGEAGVLADPRVEAFHRAAAPRLLDAGMLRLYGLRIGGTMAAAYYGIHHRGRAYAYLTGFDPALAFFSPGTLLLAHAIEEAMRDGAAEIDFLRGEEAFKRDWGAVQRRNFRRVFHRTASHALA